MKEMVMSGHLRKMTMEDYGISSSIIHRADYHLLTLPYLTQLCPLKNLVRSVLLISDVSTCIGLRPGTWFVAHLAWQLKDAMQAMDLTSLEGAEDVIVRLVLWSCFYGVELIIGLEEQSWFLHYLRQSQEILKLHKQADVLQLL